MTSCCFVLFLTIFIDQVKLQTTSQTIAAWCSTCRKRWGNKHLSLPNKEFSKLKRWFTFWQTPPKKKKSRPFTGKFWKYKRCCITGPESTSVLRGSVLAWSYVISNAKTSIWSRVCAGGCRVFPKTTEDRSVVRRNVGKRILAYLLYLYFLKEIFGLENTFCRFQFLNVILWVPPTH